MITSMTTDDNEWEEIVVQQWEMLFLSFDVHELFAVKDETKLLVSDKKKRAMDEFLQHWHHYDLWVTHKFDLYAYQQYVELLEKSLMLSSNVRMTRERVNLFRERARTFRLITIQENGSIDMNVKFYYNELWQRDIDGWDLLIESNDDMDVKAWFERLKQRALLYKVLMPVELNGGPAILYDFSTDGVCPLSPVGIEV
jgi:hypothetical protein